MLLPLLMNLDMFSEPEPVTDFRGTVTQALAPRFAVTQAFAPRGTVTQALAPVGDAEQELFP